jgi:PIN domain nuclease of toxin-antitoxin system
MTTVNCCEVLGKLMEKGMSLDQSKEVISDLGVTLIDFDMSLAEEAAAIQASTRSIGASLGDRACLALAMRRSKSRSVSTVYTAEHAWNRLEWPFKIALIRPRRGTG